jgi:hypothetical protein
MADDIKKLVAGLNIDGIINAANNQMIGAGQPGLDSKYNTNIQKQIQSAAASYAGKYGATATVPGFIEFLKKGGEVGGTRTGPYLIGALEHSLTNAVNVQRDAKARRKMRQKSNVAPDMEPKAANYEQEAAEAREAAATVLNKGTPPTSPEATTNAGDGSSGDGSSGDGGQGDGGQGEGGQGDGGQGDGDGDSSETEEEDEANPFAPKPVDNTVHYAEFTGTPEQNINKMKRAMNKRLGVWDAWKKFHAANKRTGAAFDAQQNVKWDDAQYKKNTKARAKQRTPSEQNRLDNIEQLNQRTADAQAQQTAAQHFGGTERSANPENTQTLSDYRHGLEQEERDNNRVITEAIYPHYDDRMHVMVR